MYCGEEITNQINWNGIGWEDNEMKNVSNCYFHHFFWCGRNKLDFSVRKYLDHHDRKLFVVVERETLCFLYFYGGTRQKKTWERGSVGWPAAASVSSG